MHFKEWLKSAAVATAGGACAAISAVIMDPKKFNLSDGLRDEAIIALQGALVGLAALFVRSPLGVGLMKALSEARAQSASDQLLIEDLKKQLDSQAQLAQKPPQPAQGPQIKKN